MKLFVKCDKRVSSIIIAIIFFVLSIMTVVGANQISHVIKLVVNASRIPANLNIDVQTKQIPLKPIWRNIAQGGESPSFNLKSIQSELKLLMPEYIRIDHLFDFYIKVERNSQGEITCDFSKLDQLLGEINQVGAKPFISLSYTPNLLNADITGIPSNYEEYLLIIKQTVEHISGKKALNIADVYYEIWNEPDLFGQWKTYGSKNYLQLYKTAVNGAMAAKNVLPFKIGGPAITKLYRNWITALVNFAENQDLRLDFISWHFYNSDPNAITNDINELKNIMENHPLLAHQIEVIVTEWGIDSNNNPAYDTNTGAAHLVAVIAKMTPVIDRAFVFELEDGLGSEAYWGRWGLITHPNFGSYPKPRANAIKLLNQLGQFQLAVNGQGSWVKAIASKNQDRYNIIIANYDEANVHSENVPITISSLSEPKYVLTTTYLDRPPLTKNVIPINGTIVDRIPMSPNAVVLLSLKPINQ